MKTMETSFKFIMIFIILIFIYYCSALQPISDVRLQCREYDLDSNFNVSASGNVIVVYNSALCKRCQNKLFLLKSLQHRFEIADFQDLIFIMLTTELNGSTQFEELTQKAGNVTLISLQDINNDIFVPGSVYIFDKCSRLTYELVSPSSEIQNQVIKAAVLSTWYDSICGTCEHIPFDNRYIDETEDDENFTTELNEFHFENAEIVDPNEIFHDDEDLIVRDDDSNFIVPLKVIIPMQHVHKNEQNSSSYTKYNFIVLHSNDSLSHEHLSKDNTEILSEIQQPSVSVESKVPTSSSVSSSSWSNSKESQHISSGKYLSSADGTNFTVKKSLLFSNFNQTSNAYVEEIEPISNAIVITSASKNKGLTRHLDTASLLRTLHPWLSYRLIKASKDEN